MWCTLITGSKAALLIDTGFGFGDISGKVRKITNLPVTVINTHGHVDHIQGNKFFDTVLLHEDDRRIIKQYSSFPVKLAVYLGSKKTLSPEEKRNVPAFFKRNVQNLQYIHDGHLILSSHSPAVFKTTILEKILHCAGHIDVGKSIVYDSHLAGKGLLYNEGFEKIQAAYGYDTFEEFVKHAGEIAPEEIADIEFVSIVYTKKKLG